MRRTAAASGALLLAGLLLPAARPTPARELPFAESLIGTSTHYGFDRVELVDMDRDGDLDALSQIRIELLWHENVLGDGTSWAPHAISTAGFGIPLSAADVDRDGDLDVIWLDVCCQGDESERGVKWSRNDNGIGTQWTTFAIDDGEKDSWELAVADLDGDGDVDAAIGEQRVGSTRIYWYENLSDGAGWSRHDVSELMPHDDTGLAAGDLDGDGDVDLVSAEAHYESGLDFEYRIRWYENAAGNGASWIAHTVRIWTADSSIYYDDVALADFDGDGDLDIATQAYAEEPSATVRWQENRDHAAAWTEHIVATDSWLGQSLCVADVDRDGDVDLLSSAWGGSNLVWHDSIDHALSWRGQTLGGCSWSGAAGDVDGDGDVDVASGPCGSDSSVAELALHKNQDLHRSAVHYAMPPVTESADGAHAAVSADLDSDGDLDLALAAESDDGVAWYANADGHGTSWTEHFMTDVWDRPSALAPADVNGDGGVDLVVAYAGADRIAWFPNLGGSGPDGELSSRLVASGVNEVRAIDTADVDRDGDPDVVAAYQDGVGWWETTNPDAPDASWAFHFVGSLLGGSAVHVADVNRDGLPDVVTGASGDDTVHWWQQVRVSPTSFVWVPHLVSSTADGVASLAVGDVDGDGDADVVGALSDANRVVWWKNMDGQGSFSPPGTIYPSASCPGGVSLSDLDLDGDLDVLGASYCDSRVVAYANEAGDGSSWSRRVISDVGRTWGARMAGAADMDGDGAPDVFAAAELADSLVWFQNRGGHVLLETTNTAPASILEYFHSDDVLRIVATHRGKLGDLDAELTTIGLLFLDGSSRSLTLEQAQALFDAVEIYVDTGTGVFEPETDTFVASSTVDPADGLQAVTLPDGSAATRISFGTPRTYFVVVRLAANAGAQTPNTFRLQHVPMVVDGSRTQNRDHDTPLLLEYSSAVLSGVVTALRDTDRDERPDGSDNCPALANPDQADGDGDGVGNVCDNCPATANADQLDSDGDGRGNACDNCAAVANPDQLDVDGDTFGNVCDNCPSTWNGDQRDVDGDGRGDVCDNCVFTANPNQLDLDRDGRGDACDNCPSTANADQLDGDGDRVGNVCDNCASVANPGQENADGDARGDVCDNCAGVANDDQRDGDKDAVGDVCDNCRYTANPGQEDSGGVGRPLPDGIGDVCQCGDVSGDGLVTIADAILVQRSLLVPPTATQRRPELCDVGGSQGCTVTDAIILRRALLVPPTATIVQQCRPASP